MINEKEIIEPNKLKIKFTLEAALKIEERFGSLQNGIKELKNLKTAIWIYKEMYNNSVRNYNRYCRERDKKAEISDINEVVLIEGMEDCLGFVSIVYKIVFNAMPKEKKSCKKKAHAKLTMMLKQLLCR